jgi:hypothetical protein
LILPTAASWNVLATIERETREHEAGHAAAAHVLGFEVGEIVLDRWADWGEFDSVRFKWSDTIADAEELAFARAIVAAAGPLVTDSWELDRSRQDRDKIEEVRWPGWSSAAWEFVVLAKTERLIRSESFRSLHRRIVAALEEVGEVGTLSGDELDRVLATSGAAPPFHDGSPRPFAAASVAPGVHPTAKAADAAPGGLDLGPPDPSAVGAS